MLSNNHVFANTNRGRVGDAVLQPGPSDRGKAGDLVGWLSGAKRIVRRGNSIDAALAVMSAAMDYEPVYDGDRLAGVRAAIDIGDVVWKVGLHAILVVVPRRLASGSSARKRRAMRGPRIHLSGGGNRVVSLAPR
jgi:hypothetical protein